MSEDRRERRGPFVGCLAIGLVLGLPLYVLSVGPFFWLADRGYLPREVGVIYTPLGFLMSVCPPFESVFRWYAALWH